ARAATDAQSHKVGKAPAQSVLPPRGRMASAARPEARRQRAGIHGDLEGLLAGHLDDGDPDAVPALQVVVAVDEHLVEAQGDGPSDVRDHRSSLVAEPTSPARVHADQGWHDSTS